MSFMPDVGTPVRLIDGRGALVSQVTPSGNDDRVRLADGREEKITAWDIAITYDYDHDQEWLCERGGRSKEQPNKPASATTTRFS
jgi:hypothetical protein